MVQSLERAFAILDAVADRPAGRDSDRRTGSVCRSRTVARPALLARSARRRRTLGRSPLAGRPGRCCAGRGLPRSSGASCSSRDPSSSGSWAELGEDAGLGLPDGHEMHYVDQVECDHPVQVRDWTGTRAPHARGAVRARTPRRLVGGGGHGVRREWAGGADSADRYRSGAAPCAARGRCALRLRVGARGVRRGNQLGRRAGSRRRAGTRSPRSTSTARRTGFPPQDRRATDAVVVAAASVSRLLGL